MKSIFSGRFAFCVFKINLISFSVCLSPLSFPPSQSLPLSPSLSLCLPLSICFLQLIYYYYCCFPPVVWVVSLVWVAAVLLLDSPRCVASLSCCVYWIPPVASILRFEMFNQYAAKYIRIPESVKLWQTARQAGGNHLQLTYREHDLGWFSALASLASLACHSVQLCRNCFSYATEEEYIAQIFNDRGGVERGEQCMQKVCALPLEHGKYTAHLLVHK